MKITNGAYEEDKNHTFDNQNLALNVKYAIPVFEWWESTPLFSYMNQYQRDKNLPDFYEFLTSEITQRRIRLVRILKHDIQGQDDVRGI